MADAEARLERLEADRDLQLLLALNGYAGRTWDAFATVLAEYGFAVISAWTRTGLIRRKCAGRGIAVCSGPLPGTSDAIDIATDVVVEAIAAFRANVLVPGRWDYTQGATLKTFFIGQCLFQYPNYYRAWVGRARRQRQLQSALRATSWVDSLPVALEDQVELNRAIDRIGGQPDAVAMVVADEMGFDHAEIALALGLSARAVEGSLYRFRKRRQ